MKSNEEKQIIEEMCGKLEKILFKDIERLVDTNVFNEKEILKFSKTFLRYKSFLGTYKEKDLYKAYARAALFDDYKGLYSLFMYSNFELFTSSSKDYFKQLKKITPLIITEEINKLSTNKEIIEKSNDEDFEILMGYSKKDLKEGVLQAFLANNIGPIIKVLPENNFFQAYRDLRKQNKIDNIKFEELAYYLPNLNRLILDL